MEFEAMYRFLICIGILVLIFSGCAIVEHRATPEEEKVILWLDGTANFERLGTEEGIERIFDKAKNTGVTDLVLCVKRSNGYVLYESEYAPQLKEWQGFRREDDFDFVNIALNQAHKRGMSLHLSFNIFAEGDRTREMGVLYEDEEKREWETLLYTPEGFVPATEFGRGFAAFTNPALPEVQRYQLKILREATERFKPDGIILDRCRYDGIESDFSDFSHQQFEKYLVEPRQKTRPILDNFPEDIFAWEEENGSYDYKPGPYFKEWLEWRASIIRDFVEESRRLVKEIDPEIDFANYVGAWYPTYYELGVNWAAKEYDPARDYEWASDYYYRTSFLELFDWLMVGNYFYEVTIEELREADEEELGARTEDAMYEGREDWYSVEGSALLAMDITRNVIPVYGSLYVQQYEDQDDPEQFQKAIEMVRRLTDGVMIFDLVHLENYDYWPYFKDGVDKKFD